MAGAAIYCRVSVDRDQDAATIERQESECRALATSKGFDTFEVFVDRNLSAFKRGVIRPAYDQMKSRVAEGAFEAIFAYRLDRLSRSLAEALKLIELLDDHNCALVMVNGDVDTTGRMGKAFFQISAIFAELEAATTSERLKSYNRDAASKGSYKTGGRRCYGYTYQGEPVKDEVAYIRMAVGELMAGTSLIETCKRLNRDGSRTTMGAEWQVKTLKGLLTSPRLIGVRVHNGQLTQGDWQPILTETEQAKLIARLTKNSSSYVPPRTHSRLLTSLLRCQCGAKMSYGRAKHGDKLYVSYRCHKLPGRAGCGNVSISERYLNQYVILTVRYFGSYFSELATPKRITLEEDRCSATGALQEARAALQALRTERFRVGVGTMSDAEYAELRVPLEATIAELIEAITRFDRQIDSLPAEKPAPKFLKGRMDKLPGTIDEQRAFIRQYLDTIVISRAKTKGGRFDPNRVELHWRSGEITNDLDLVHADNIGVDDAEAWNAFAHPHLTSAH